MRNSKLMLISTLPLLPTRVSNSGKNHLSLIQSALSTTFRAAHKMDSRAFSMRTATPNPQNSHHNATALMDSLWQDFTTKNPAVSQIYALFKQQTLRNDHIAFRTLQHDQLGKQAIAQHFINLGYRIKGEYHFAGKHLDAIHLEQAEQPRIFISELRLQDCVAEVQAILQPIAEQCAADPLTQTQQLLTSGRRWPIHQAHYLALRAVSEYAAWFYVFGHTPNHFTIDVNALENFDSLAQVNDFLKLHNVALNNVGGEIKSAAGKLDQSSTLADKVSVTFADQQTLEIPFTFVEFAYRHQQPNGTLYSGFAEGNADKIFSSTDASAPRKPL